MAQLRTAHKPKPEGLKAKTKQPHHVLCQMQVRHRSWSLWEHDSVIVLVAEGDSRDLGVMSSVYVATVSFRELLFKVFLHCLNVSSSWFLLIMMMVGKLFGMRPRFTLNKIYLPVQSCFIEYKHIEELYIYNLAYGQQQ